MALISRHFSSIFQVKVVDKKREKSVLEEVVRELDKRENDFLPQVQLSIKEVSRRIDSCNCRLHDHYVSYQLRFFCLLRAQRAWSGIYKASFLFQHFARPKYSSMT